MAVNLGELAFEHGITVESVMVYRVTATVEVLASKRSATRIHWFANKADAEDFRTTRGTAGESVSVTCYRQVRTPLGQKLTELRDAMPPANYIADDPVYPQEIRIAGRRVFIRHERGAVFLDVERDEA